MNNQIKTLLVSKEKCHIVTLFGYTNKGIPGLELIGLGPLGRALKEKIIFLSKERSLKASMNKYMICLDSMEHINGSLKASMNKYMICLDSMEHINDKKFWDLSWLEFPLTLLFWSLTKNLPISKLDNCLAVGRISINGQVIHYPISDESWGDVEQYCEEQKSRVHYIGEKLPQEMERVHLLESKKLFTTHQSQRAFV